MLGSDVGLSDHNDVRLLPSQDHSGELLCVDGRRAADVQRSVRRLCSVATHRARRMRASVGHLVGSQETRSRLGFT